MAVTQAIKQHLELPRWGLIRPSAPVAPQHDPWLQPRPDSPQRGRPGALRSGWLRAPHFPPAPSSGRRQGSSWLVGRRSGLSGCGGTSKTRRRSTPRPNAAGWQYPSAPGTRSSRALLLFACSFAPPSFSSHTAAQPRLGPPPARRRSPPLALTRKRADWW